MIVEFFGLPGSGKTFCAHALARKHNIPVFSVSNRFEKYVFVILFSCLHTGSFLFFLKEFISNNSHDPPLLRHKIRTTYFNTIAREQKAAFSNKKGIIDEGFFQMLLALYERRAEKPELLECIRYIPPRTIFLVESKKATRETRMAKRGRVPRGFFLRDVSYHKHWFPIIERNYDEIKHLVIARYRHGIIRNE